MDEVLFPYQIEGAQWLSGRKTALLADDMGLGKSAQAVSAADMVGANRILILCPASARINWVREFLKFSPVKREFKLITRRDQVIDGLDSAICSYDLIPENNAGVVNYFDLLILDEVHYLKSWETKRSKRVFGKHGLVRVSERVWGLSGTPAPNHAGELWPMLYTFGATPLTYSQFIDKYCNHYMGPNFDQRITGTKRGMIPEIKNLLSKIMIRRKKEDVLKELPPIHYTDIQVEPGPVDLDIEQSFTQYVYPIDRKAELFQKLKEELALLNGVIDRTGFTSDGMAALGAIAASISTLRRYTGIQKVKAVSDMVTDELENKAYEKVVIFAIHRDVIEGLRNSLRKFKPVTLYGGTDPEKRQNNIDKFQNNPSCRVFIGNIMAAGTAITLTAAHNVVFLEQDWVPGNNAQAAMRCHRIGQTKPVVVRFIGLANSIDEKISKILKRKAKELTEIFDVKE